MIYKTMISKNQRLFLGEKLKRMIITTAIKTRTVVTATHASLLLTDMIHGLVLQSHCTKLPGTGKTCEEGNERTPQMTL
jgi:hypothetical protein